MGKKLYIGNINYATTEDQLTDMFSQFGSVVSCDIIVDRFSGQSKGFGFVEMEREEDAKSAIESLDGRELDGRQLRVNEAKERPSGSRRPPREY